jgi:hypothetical protein
LAHIDEDRAVGGLDLHPALLAFLERLSQAHEDLFRKAE